MKYPELLSYRSVRKTLMASRNTTHVPVVPDVPWKLPYHYQRLVSAVGPQAIAGDFIIETGTETRSENLLSDYPRLELGISWMIFATSGMGDAWALRLGSKTLTVAFVNHDDEHEADATLLGLELKSWLRLAYLMRELEQLEKAIGEITTDIANHVRNELDRLSPGLSTRYPYKLN